MFARAYAHAKSDEKVGASITPILDAAQQCKGPFFTVRLSDSVTVFTDRGFRSSLLLAPKSGALGRWVVMLENGKQWLIRFRVSARLIDCDGEPAVLVDKMCPWVLS
jgi:hypothetical protein